MTVYQGLFPTWADVQREFETTEPEPEEVLIARYEYECYEGDATVLYRNGHAYYLVEGSHCSCHGLEGQWKPEEFDPATLEAFLKRVSK